MFSLPLRVNSYTGRHLNLRAYFSFILNQLHAKNPAQHYMMKDKMYPVNFLLCPNYSEGREVHSDSCRYLSCHVPVLPCSSRICGIKQLQVRTALRCSVVAKLQELLQQLERCRALTVTAPPHFYFRYFHTLRLPPGGHICCIYGLIQPLWRRHYPIFQNRNY